MALRLSLAVVSLMIVSGCQRGSTSPQDAGSIRASAKGVRRPPAPGDYKRGWELFLDHCANCHGAKRRGAGLARRSLLKSPADLRDPLLLASRTDDELMHAILQGGLFAGKTKWMPGFARELSEQDVLDLVALIRGDSIYLVECFPEADVYVSVALREPGPPVLAAYDVGPGSGSTPQVVDSVEKLPKKKTRLVGFLMFAELDLGRAGPTPVAFLANSEGEVSGIRVALPVPDNERAQKDLEDTVIRRVPKLPQLTQVLDAGVERLVVAARANRPSQVNTRYRP